MRARTSLTNPWTQWLIAALIALAPLACIAYCRITHEVAHRQGHANMLHGADEAPLNDMQQLVHAVTDALPVLMAWFTLVIAITLRFSLRVDALQRTLVPPTPPPKAVVFLAVR